MTLKKLIIIGSISVVAVATSIVVPIVIIKSNKNKKNQPASQNNSIRIENILSDDELGAEMQESLNNCFDSYYTAASTNNNITLVDKSLVYVCATSGLHNTSGNKNIYFWNMNDAVWDLYESSNIGLTPVVTPEQAFGGYYVYYQPTV